MVFNNMERRITALTAQRKNPNRINVFLDGEFVFGLYRITAAWLRIGELLSEERITRLQEQDGLEVAYQRALEFLSYRPRSEKEIRQRLTEKGYTENSVEAVLERLRRAGLVSDEQFAHAWTENRVTFRPRSRRMVAAELRQKGIGQETIEQTLNEMPAEDALAYEAGKKYSRRLEGLSWEDFRQKMAGHLGRKGFGYGTVAEVTKRIWQEMHDETV
jgi:regulatory protein